MSLLPNRMLAQSRQKPVYASNSAAGCRAAAPTTMAHASVRALASTPAAADRATPSCSPTPGRSPDVVGSVDRAVSLMMRKPYAAVLMSLACEASLPVAANAARPAIPERKRLSQRGWYWSQLTSAWLAMPGTRITSPAMHAR